MYLAIEAIQFFSAAGLALFVGALLTEAVVLVPMWRSLPAQDFLHFMQHTLIVCTDSWFRTAIGLGALASSLLSLRGIN
jgi:hypothetical protein